MKRYVIFLLVFFLIPFLGLAHQPRIVETGETVVKNPEISQAFYGKLTGGPHIFYIDAPEAFRLYVNVLVPDISNQKKDVSAAIIKDGNLDEPVAILEGINFNWEWFWEEFGYDGYWRGPEYEASAEPGKYEIRVWSSNNDSKYSLAIGKIEAFDLAESRNALTLISILKKDFFETSPANFIFSPIGIAYIVLIFAAAFLFGFLYRLLFKTIYKKYRPYGINNIGRRDRFARAVLGLCLFLVAIETTWNPVILFLAGFCFFEAIFSWCAVYAAIGKNMCPLE